MQKVKNLFCENRGRKLAVLLLGAFGYALLTALCSQIEQFGATAWSRTLARFAAAFPIAFVVLAALLAIAMPKLMCRPRESQKPFCTWGAALLFFACYTPMLLIEFPGSFTYDVTAQTFQIAKNSYSMFYPLAHTLLLKFCLDAYGLLQSFEKCALLCSAIQMTLVSICFALVCASISRACSRRAARIAAAFFALCPYHAVFASNFTKDVLFAAFLAVFVAYTLEYVQAGGLCARRMAMCVFAGMMACLLRNNMIYAMLVWVALLLVFGRGVRRAACWALLAAVLGMGANQALAALTHADSGDAKEMLSVPAQQLSRVYTLAPETFTEEEMVAMDTYFGNEGYTRYDATLADFTKNDLSTDVILEDKAGFFKLWLTIGQRRPDLYLDALLELDLPFLYPYRAYAGTAKYIETGMSPRADHAVRRRRHESARAIQGRARLAGRAHLVNRCAGYSGAALGVQRGRCDLADAAFRALCDVHGELEAIWYSASADSAVGHVSARPGDAGAVSVSVCLHAPVAAGRAERGGDGEDGWGAAPSPGNSHSCF